MLLQARSIVTVPKMNYIAIRGSGNPNDEGMHRFMEEPLRLQGLGTCLLKEAEEFARENNVSMVLTNAGDWNVDFFKKNGYLIRGELKDVPKGHTCFELYKMI